MAVALEAREVEGSPRRTLLRRPQLGLIGLAVVLALPYAVMGPGFVLDDWFLLRNAHFDGPLWAYGSANWAARPGALVTFFLTFGLIGPHPLLLYGAQVALSSVTAVLLYRLLARMLPATTALGVAAVWLVLPNHGSLVRWAATVNIAVALVLLLGACLLLTSPRPSVRKDVVAALLLAAATLSYEAMGPAAVAVALVLPRLARGRWAWRTTAIGWAGAGAAAAWMVAHFDPNKSGIDARLDPATVWPAHFGWGVVPYGVATTATGLLALAGMTLVVLQFRPGRGRPSGHAEVMVLAGLAVIAVGTVPFLGYFYEPIGAGDRANAVAAIGTALCWAGFATLAWAHRRAVTAVAGVAVVGLMLAAGLQADAAWHWAGRSAERTLAALPPATPDGELVVGPRPVVRRNVAPFLDRSNIESAVQLRLDDRAVRARMSRDEADFEATPPELRIRLQ